MSLILRACTHITLLAVAGSAVSGQERASEIYKSVERSVFLISVQDKSGSTISVGSGFVINKGLLATNWHVVKGGKAVLVLGDVSVPLEVTRRDIVADLAIVLVAAEITAAPLKLAEKDAAPGDSIFVIGNPEGLEKTISTGVVSGIREIGGRKLLQISAPISPGSSGGPVLNSAGDVVGVTVAMLTEGQNLNFAVPATALRQMLTSSEGPSSGFPSSRQGNSTGDREVNSLLVEVQELAKAEKGLQYSADTDSEYQKVHSRILEKLSTGLDELDLSQSALLNLAVQAAQEDPDLEIKAAEKALEVGSSAEAEFLKGDGLESKYWFAQGEEKLRLAKDAADAFRVAVQLARSPEPKAYLGLANALETVGKIAEAEKYFSQALNGATKSGDQQIRANGLRGLVRTEYGQNRAKIGDSWFQKLVESGQANPWDWDAQGDRQTNAGAYRDAAISYETAAANKYLWADWCYAALRWTGGQGDMISTTKPSPDMDDRALTDARNCVNVGAGEKQSEHALAVGHDVMAEILVKRGVFDQALNEAKEAIGLEASNALYFSALADAFFGLRQFDETVTAAKQALTLSDGKYSWVHFRLGTAYFELQNWELARQSFEKASQLEPSEPAGPYNVAMCLLNLHYNREALIWLREVIRRDAKYARDNDVYGRIASVEATLR